MGIVTRGKVFGSSERRRMSEFLLHGAEENRITCTITQQHGTMR
jgi:hypothetical protein